MKDTIPPVRHAPILNNISSPPVKPKTILKQIWEVMQCLSLDVALGAVCSSAMFFKLMNAQPLLWEQILILGGTVQLIYTLDHLWDVQHMQISPITERHIFHQKYNHQLWIFVIVSAGILGIAAVFLLPAILIYFGIGLSSMVALYLWLVNYLPQIKGKQWFHKEIIIAFIYMAGICGIALIQAPQILIVHMLLIFCFGLMAFQNLLLFSYYSLEEDIQQQQRSVVQVWGMKRTKVILWGTFILFALCIGVAYLLSFNFKTKQVSVTFAIMSAILLLLFSFPTYFNQNNLYRKIGDGIFLIPAATLLFEMMFF